MSVHDALRRDRQGKAVSPLVLLALALMPLLAVGYQLGADVLNELT